MTTVPYEVLIRLRNGQAFAQAQTLTTVDGREYENPPVALNLSGPEFDAWKTQFNAHVLAARDAAVAEVAALNQQLDAKDTELQAAAANLAAMTAARDAAIAERDAIAAELDALKNPPINVRKIPVYYFLERLTPAEQVAITQSSDVHVQIIEKRLLARQYVDLDAQRTLDALAYFQSVGLLTQQRVTELLQDAQPDELTLE